MMRRVVNTPRRYYELADGSVEIESWVQWIQRATRRAECQFQKFGIPGWVEQQRGRKDRLQDKTLQCGDRRWSKISVDWNPEGVRLTGRPRRRWQD